MEIAYSADELAFLAEVRAFLSDYAERHRTTHSRQQLYGELGERNWLALSWPTEVGGLGLGPVYEFLLWDEMAHMGFGRPPLAAGIVAKTIIRYGSDEQKETWLPPIRAGKLMFSLG